jgi:hypothetical protein
VNLVVESNAKPDIWLGYIAVQFLMITRADSFKSVGLEYAIFFKQTLRDPDAINQLLLGISRYFDADADQGAPP